MVSCGLANKSCSGGALAGEFLYPTSINTGSGQQVKLQIITNAAECDDTDYVPVDYCIDWDDGTKSSGTFRTGYNIAKNEEVTHVYYNSDPYHTSIGKHPVVTISTACGGIRTVANGESGVSCQIDVYRDGVAVPTPNMSTYRLHPDFNIKTCAGIFPDCTGTELSESCVNGYKQMCVEGYWARDQSRPCSSGAGGGGGELSCTGEVRCLQNGMEYKYCTQNGQTGWIGSGRSCNPASPQEGSTRCIGTSGQRMVNGQWVNDTTVSCQGVGSNDIIPPSGSAGGDDIFASIMDFYNNNKLISIAGIALLGGIVVFGGSK